MDNNYFANLINDSTYGTYRLPSLGVYAERIEILRDKGIPDDLIAIEAQRDWHSRGQNGCNFARIAARKAIELGWSSHFIEGESISNVGNLLENAENDSNCEILSLVFPKISARDLVNRITELTEVSSFYLEKDELIEDGSKRQLYLRYPLQLGRIASWSMCFAPYDFMPNTRRSPYIEIATRMKEKPGNLHEMLNKNPNEAHLADMIVDTSEHIGHRIARTIDRTHRILGEKPNHITAAKSTLVVPIEEL